MPRKSIWLKKIENIEEVGFHRFSRNQKIVTDGFPWSLDTEPKYWFPWDLKYVLPENIHTPPPPTEDSLICTPTPQIFHSRGSFMTPSPKEVWNGDFAQHPLERSPLPFGISNDHPLGGGGVWIFYVILRLPCTCQWTVDSIGKSGCCSKSQNPKVDFK